MHSCLHERACACLRVTLTWRLFSSDRLVAALLEKASGAESLASQAAPLYDCMTPCLTVPAGSPSRGGDVMVYV